MCDTVGQVQPTRTLFAKNSDRPAGEPQVIEAFGARTPGSTLRTQYLEIADEGALPVLGSRPDWLWGLEHGVNAAGVAIGNEKVWTTRDGDARRPALIGMDLVRLGLERARRADEAVEVMVELLEAHGQGGVADAIDDEAYYSSFLVLDGRGGWVLETVGRTWAAKPVDGAAAISNRISLGTDWTRASADLAPGDDFDALREPAWGPVADVRLACTLPAVAEEGPLEPADLAGLMRHHGTRPWGAPGVGAATDLEPLPSPDVGPDGTGITVCMHLRGYQATAASMVAELPGTSDPDFHADAPPVRAWVALGSPCASVYVPVWVTDGVPAALAEVGTWSRFAALRQRVEEGPDGGREALSEVRAVLAPLEAELWQEADVLHQSARSADGDRRAVFATDAWRRIDEALTTLGV
ncbi:hypothetical protein [Rhabdothermincola salaria]|uniref:hypothetical protein n=1 Tax=Rhabdothermincola salaria TaxID=2903142 RepID=UPI001E559277|nr:hypothetical protein [Rhabdothermincola salaria]MCD9623828.1 hypothetical protein [Rhabdothermincola salaria]